jgi:hypothetical protein
MRVTARGFVLRQLSPTLVFSYRPSWVCATLLLGRCLIYRDPHSAAVDSHQKLLGILGLDHKAAPSIVDGPIDWNDAAKWTGWNCVAIGCLKFPLGLTKVAEFE